MPGHDQRGKEFSYHYAVPNPEQVFSLSPNNAGLLNFPCVRWCDEEQLEPALGSTRLFLGGGFKDETRGVFVTAGTGKYVAALESTQQESYYIPYTVFRTKMSNELSFTRMTRALSRNQPRPGVHP